MDRVTFLDKKIKIASLCNLEQSHIFGLNLISILQCDLDTLLLLETQYNSTSILLNLQKSNRPSTINFDFNSKETDDSNRESPTNDDDDQLKNVDETIE